MKSYLNFSNSLVLAGLSLFVFLPSAALADPSSISGTNQQGKNPKVLLIGDSLTNGTVIKSDLEKAFPGNLKIESNDSRTTKDPNIAEKIKENNGVEVVAFALGANPWTPKEVKQIISSVSGKKCVWIGPIYMPKHAEFRDKRDEDLKKVVEGTGKCTYVSVWEETKSAACGKDLDSEDCLKDYATELRGDDACKIIPTPPNCKIRGVHLAVGNSGGGALNKKFENKITEAINSQLAKARPSPSQGAQGTSAMPDRTTPPPQLREPAPPTPPTSAGSVTPPAQGQPRPQIASAPAPKSAGVANSCQESCGPTCTEKDLPRPTKPAANTTRLPFY